MEIIGRIFKIAPDVRSGVSTKTGKAWTNRDVVIEVDDPYITKEGERAVWHQTFVFTLGGDSAENFNLDVGTKVKIKYVANHTEYGGRFYETKLIRSIELCP